MMREALIGLEKWAAEFRNKINNSWWYGLFHRKSIKGLNDDQLLRYHDNQFNLNNNSTINNKHKL